MANRSGMIVHDGIGPVLDYLFLSAAGNVADAMEMGALEVEAHARATAPWSDRTGAARDGLVASVYNDFGEIVLELAHSVDYGIWLELIQGGRFAVIMPTLEALGPQIIRDAGGRVMHTGGGW